MSRATFLLSCSLMLALSACMPMSANVALKPQSIPSTGIYAPPDVVVAGHGQAYEFAAAGVPGTSTDEITRVIYCSASMYATEHGLSGWFVKDAIDTPTPQMHEVNIILDFYRGEKPWFVENLNSTDWCNPQPPAPVTQQDGWQ